jgi:beta propeller repeat protein
MGTKGKFCLVILAFLFLISFTSAAASAASTQRIDGQFTLIETPITNNESDQIDPAVYGDRIVWQDERNGHWDIYLYNLSTSTETRIATDESNQTKPAIYGDRIVWQDDRNGNWDIYMYDLSAQKETQITDEPNDQVNPAIYTDRIVWQDDRNGNWDIYLYDLSAQKETQITTDKSDHTKPVIYGDRIVWQDDRNGREIYLYELSTSRMLFNLLWNNQNLDVFSIISGFNKSKVQKIVKSITSRETSIASYGSDKYEPPAIYGNKIVWADRRNTNLSSPAANNPGIYLYDISTSVETLITTGFTSDKSYLFPAVYEKRIVWQDGRNGNSDIYMYDISTSTETRITTNESKQEMPSIYGDRIVWQDERNGNWDIYMCTLAPASAKPTSPISNAYKNGLNLISRFFLRS